jgi:hypothetical protein
MEGSDEIMASTLFLGTYPGLTGAMMDKEIDVIKEFVAGHASNSAQDAE